MLTLKHYQPKQFSSLIERITIGKTTDSEFNLMFIPSHFVTLFIPLNNSNFSYNGINYSKPVLKNFHLKPAYLHIPKNSYLLGIRFYPFGAFPFSGLVSPRSGYKKISEDSAIIEMVFRSLRANYNKEKEKQTKLLKDFYYNLLNNAKYFSVKNFCAQKEINYMPLYRYFKRMLNISPKKFERLIKFRLSVNYMILVKQKLTNVSLDSGYYDQSHFIKEFKYFVGMTPSEYIKYLSENDLFNFYEYANFCSLKGFAK